MATQAPTTCVPTCAPVIPFPDTLVAQARRELNYCRNQRMFDRWVKRAEKYQQLSHDERITIGHHAVERRRIVLAEGC